MREEESKSPNSENFETPWLGLGVALGAAVGVATSNLAVWIGVGVALGAALRGAQRRRDPDSKS